MASSSSQTKQGLSIAQREMIWGLIFLAPWIVGFLLFTIVPMITSLVFSFSSFNLIKPEDGMKFVGFANYTRMFNDPQLLNAIGVTLRFSLISVPLSIGVPLALAVIVNSKHLFGKNIFRTLFFMPRMIPVVVGVMVWGGILNSESGWFNRFLGIFNIEGPRWFQDEKWVLVTLSIMGIWGVGQTMLTLLAGLQNVPTELYEAATVDGANPFQSFFNITVPMISPIIFYNLILSIIGALQQFNEAFIIGNGRGDPNGSTFFYNIYLFKTAFASLDMGYGATLAWIMFLVGLILTVVLFWTSNRWVYYAYSGHEE